MLAKTKTECFNLQMKITFVYALLFSLIGLAYFSAQSKMRSAEVQSIRLGMNMEDLEDAFGTPSAQERNRIIYIFEDHSELMITLRDNIVASARLKFHRPLKIGDPKMKQLTLVQMESDANSSRPSWFFAGKPEEGLIYKITGNGAVESLTWVPPFTYGTTQPKRLQALLRDFQNKHLSKM
jgi:hypothetical protein